MTTPRTSGNVIIQDPPFVTDLFNNTRWAWLWLILRLYLGYEWLSAGLEKLTPPWLQTGTALQGFWTRAIQVPEAPARPPIAFGWYRDFIQFLLNSQSYIWFAKLIVAGEIIVGIMLLLGAFTGIAAFLGAFLNWNFMMAGSASINPLMFVFTILLILAWKTAGWLGLDRWLLPLVGTPWQSKEQVRASSSALPVTGPQETSPHRSAAVERGGEIEDTDRDNDINTPV
jgi:thiosulfate dehydrogenase [quinone] large subunit